MARPRAADSRPGGAPIPPWIVFFALVACAVLGGMRLHRHAEKRGVGVVDSSRFRLHEAANYTHPAWTDQVARVLHRTGGELPADDPAAIEALRVELAALPFVAEVGTPEVIWPDGLSVPLLYRQPSACVRTGDMFLPVDFDGNLLSGRSITPHDAYGAWLPVIGRHEARLDLARPGDVLRERRQLAALAVAASMWEHLHPDDVLALGRMVIDASSDYAPDGLPGGVVIDLEERRRILFGRAPVHPRLAVAGERPGAGELPLEAKWANVRTAARALASGKDWVLFDARWDVPEVILRGSEYDLTMATRTAGG